MFRKIKQMNARHHERKKRQLEEMNQTIQITDILASERAGSIPLCMRTSCSVDKMAAEIKLLANVANSYHESQNFIDVNGQLSLKTAHENRMTRLITSEFLFYPSNRPLMMSEFGELIGKIEEIASCYHENLLLVLSSFPVEITDRNMKSVVQNFVIHVQCGAPPKMETFAKITPSYADPVYSNKPNILYSETRGYNNPDSNANAPAAVTQLPSAKNMPAVRYGGICYPRSAGGAIFTTVVDICLDHDYAEGKAKFMQELERSLSCKDRLIPDQVSHILTSNTIDIDSSHCISSTVIQADPFVFCKKPKIKLNSRQQWYKSFKQLRDIPRLYFGNQKIIINDCPLGITLRIVFLKKRALDRLSDQLADRVASHNQAVLGENLYNVSLDKNKKRLISRVDADDHYDETNDPRKRVRG